MTRKPKKFPVFLWHRRLGLIAMLLVIILSVTGIMLNHTEGLKLDEKPVQSEWLLDWYGLNPKGVSSSFPAGKNIITQWDHQLFFNQHSLIYSDQNLKGAVVTNGIIAIALEQMIILLDTSGELIEQVETGINHVTNIGLQDQRIILKTEDMNTYISDEQIITWKIVNANTALWSSKIQLSEELRLAIKNNFRGNGLTQERVILDLHSGRLFNSQWGVYIMDASAIIMMLLSVSGLWVWWSRKRKMRTKRHYQKHH